MATYHTQIKVSLTKPACARLYVLVEFQKWPMYVKTNLILNAAYQDCKNVIMVIHFHIQVPYMTETRVG